MLLLRLAVDNVSNGDNYRKPIASLYFRSTAAPGGRSLHTDPEDASAPALFHRHVRPPAPDPAPDAACDLALSAIDTSDNPALVDGTPFIVGDDGSYDLDLNRFFRECPSMGVRSPNSVRAYARDILTWARFLAERRGGKSVWKIDRQDVIAYHRARRLVPGPARLSARLGTAR